MKAFILYSRNEIELRKALDKLKNYGKINCTFEQFNQIFVEWHEKTFPNCPVNIRTAFFRDDWFIDFVNFIANYEIKKEE